MRGRRRSSLVGASRMMNMCLLVLSLLIAFAAATEGLTAEPLRIGGRKQVFFGPWTEDGRDAHLVAAMENVTMKMNRAQVTGQRLLEVDKPWEGAGRELSLLDMRQCVVKDDNVFRMYYGAMPTYPHLWSKPNCRILCYAESDDGIHWRKPNLGMCTWEGSNENNIILPYDGMNFQFSELDGAFVFIDPHASRPERKYKMIVKIKPVPSKYREEGKIVLPKKAQYVMASPDGIRWTLLSDTPVSRGASDTQYSAFWDTSIGKYVTYTRMKPGTPNYQQYWTERFGVTGRPADLSVGRQTSEDFVHWSDEQLVLRPDKIDLAGCPPGLTRLDFYGGNMTKYEEASDVYIGLPNAYYHWDVDATRARHSHRPGKHPHLPATMDAHLVTSRDGIQWNRTPKRQPFIRLGREGTFWSKQIYADGKAIRMGDELWFYFAGLDVSHHMQTWKQSNGARGVAKLRLDGFVSADAAYTGGELTTVPLLFDGGRLQLNIDTSAGGTVRVEIQDETGNPIDGFTAADADEINGNYVRKVVTWNKDHDVSQLSGTPVQLRFVMRDCKLYSFQFIDEQ